MTATTHTDRFSAVLGNRRGTGDACFDVVLSAVGERKIQVIKVLRSASSVPAPTPLGYTYTLGLKAAKLLTDVAEKSPVVVGDRLDTREAYALKDALEVAGATVIVR